jgi:hypothetical protein
VITKNTSLSLAYLSSSSGVSAVVELPAFFKVRQILFLFFNYFWGCLYFYLAQGMQELNSSTIGDHCVLVGEGF